MTYTQERLADLLTTDREKLTRICAEVCYGWDMSDNFDPCTLPRAEFLQRTYFNPLANTEKGRSQAFELAVKFGLSMFLNMADEWTVRGNGLNSVSNKKLQNAIVIASILTAQQGKQG